MGDKHKYTNKCPVSYTARHQTTDKGKVCIHSILFLWSFLAFLLILLFFPFLSSHFCLFNVSHFPPSYSDLLLFLLCLSSSFNPSVVFLFFCFPFTSYLKGQLPRQSESQHDHPSHPEEENVMARLQQRGGVVFCQVRCLPSTLPARPPQCGKREQC